MVRLALKTCRMKGRRGSRGQNLRYSTRTPQYCLSHLGVRTLSMQPVSPVLLLTPEPHASSIEMQEVRSGVQTHAA